MARLLKWIVNIILLCSILTAAALLIPPLAGITTVMMDDVGLETNLPEGSVTYATTKSADELDVGDKILVTKDGNDYIYRLKNIDTGDGTCTLEKKGSSEDAITTVFRNGAPKVILTVPLIGYIPMAMKSVEGVIIIALAVVFVIILFILAELWRADRDDDLDDGEAAAENEEQYLKERNKKEQRQKKKAQKVTDRQEKKEQRKKRTKPRVVSADGETSSQIMEQANSAIASAVSDVVAENRQKKEEKESFLLEDEELFDGLDEIDRKLREERQEAPVSTGNTKIMDFDLKGTLWNVADGENGESGEEKSATKDITVEQLTKANAEPEEKEIKSEWESKEPEAEDSAENFEEITEEQEEEGESIEQALEEYLGESAAALDEQNEEADEEEEEFIRPLHSAEELIGKAKEKGEEPEIIQDDEAGVTILDYTDLL